jgi:hypothetical protein
MSDERRAQADRFKAAAASTRPSRGFRGRNQIMVDAWDLGSAHGRERGLQQFLGHPELAAPAVATVLAGESPPMDAPDLSSLDRELYAKPGWWEAATAHFSNGFNGSYFAVAFDTWAAEDDAPGS